MTDPSDHPPDKLPYLMFTPRWCRTKATDIGPQTETLIKKILSHHAMRNLRKAQAILRLVQKYGKQRMEAACQRSLDFGNLNYRSIKAILEMGQDQSPQTPPVSVSPLSSLGLAFLRAPEYFAPTKEVVP